MDRGISLLLLRAVLATPPTSSMSTFRTASSLIRTSFASGDRWQQTVRRELRSWSKTNRLPGTENCPARKGAESGRDIPAPRDAKDTGRRNGIENRRTGIVSASEPDLCSGIARRYKSRQQHSRAANVFASILISCKPGVPANAMKLYRRYVRWRNISSS